MSKEYLELALLIPSASRLFPIIRKFARILRSHYPGEVLAELQLYGWVDIDTVGMVLKFAPGDDTLHELKWLGMWIRDLNIRVIELDQLIAVEREAIENEFNYFSDVKYRGDYDLERALDELDDTFLVLTEENGGRREESERKGSRMVSLGKFVSV